MKYVHTMIRVLDLEKTLSFFKILGFKELRRRENEAGKYTLVFIAFNEGDMEIELTYNWDQKEEYSVGRNFGHLAIMVEDIYKTCQDFMDAGYIISRPPRDGHMAFVRTPDKISLELLQIGDNLPISEPWASMPNSGEF